MAIPGQSIVINDPGMGLSSPASIVPLFFGRASAGSSNTVASWSSVSSLVAAHGQGPMVEAAAYVLQNAGGPVLTVRSNTTVAGANSAVTKTAVGTSTGTITVAGTANDAYETTVEIEATRTLGTGSFSYSLDNGVTYSPDITIPAGGTYAIPNTGLTLTFVPGGGPTYFEDGDTHAFTSTPPTWNAVDLAGVIAAVCADGTPWRFAVACGQAADATTAATLFSAFDTHLTSLANLHRYRGAMMDCGEGTAAAAKTAFSGVESSRILASYGTMHVASAKPFTGWAYGKQPAVLAFARNATGPTEKGFGLLSTDLKRVAGGSVPGVRVKTDGRPDISHNEADNEVLDSQRISTVRTWEGLSGAYVTEGRLKSAVGSDFTLWPLRVIMDVACETATTAQTRWIGESVRTNDDGTIDERDAKRIEGDIDGKIKAQLVSGTRAGGQSGHVQDARYTVDRAHNVFATSSIKAEVAIKPFTYIHDITTTLGFAVSIAGAE